MNLTGVGGTAVTSAVPAPVPAPVRPVGEPDPLPRHARDDTAAAAQQAAAAAAEQQRQAQQKLPPLKPLSTTEMRVMLGAIPPGQVAKRSDGTAPGLPQGSTFDLYA
jgi:hypothetical protein